MHGDYEVKKYIGLGLIFIFLQVCSVVAREQSIIIGNISTKSAEMLITSAHKINNVTVKLFLDEMKTEVAGSQIENISAEYDKEDHGSAKYLISGLKPEKKYYFNVVIESQNLASIKDAGSFQTAKDTQKISQDNQVLANDVIDVNFNEQMVSQSVGTYTSIKIANTSLLLSKNRDVNNMEFDMSNFHDVLGKTKFVNSKSIAEIVKYFGSYCGNKKVKFFRVTPEHYELPIQTEFELTQRCDKYDTYCDKEVNILDAQKVVRSLGKTNSDCDFNSDEDINSDNQIDVNDLNSISENYYKKFEY